MKRPTPLLTLLAGLVLGGAVLGADLRAGSGDAVAAPYGAPSKTVPAASGDPSPGAVSAPPSTPAPSGTAAVKPVSYAGYTTDAGQGVPLAVTVAGDRAIAYLCDGARLEAWFRGPVDASGLKLLGKSGANLTGTIGADGVVTGRVTVAGASHPYRLKIVEKPGGLYRATEPTRRAVIGWIVQDGRQTGLATGPSGSAPAPPLDPVDLTATVDGAPVTAAPADPLAAP